MWSENNEKFSKFPEADIFLILPKEEEPPQSFTVTKIYNGKHKWKRNQHKELRPEIYDDDTPVVHLFGNEICNILVNTQFSEKKKTIIQA